MVELEVLRNVLIGGFLLAFILGIVANKTDFCTMGAVSDWVNMGDKNRFRAWVLAIAVAIIGVMAMEWVAVTDMSLTTSNETSNPPYRTPNFVWLRYIVGGIIFGVGMTLASGCGNKTLLRLGAGNIKSIFVLAAVTIGATLMIFTNFGFDVFLQWMNPVGWDVSEMGATGQDLGSVVHALSGASDAATLNAVIGAVLALLMLIWVFKSSDFRQHKDLLFAGLVIGAVIVGAWYLTAGPMGQLVLEEVEFLDERPFALGAQSFTFIAPTAHAYQYFTGGLMPEHLTFGLVAAFGVLCGSFVYALVARKFRIEWFYSVGDFFMHLIGGLMMGIGGVLSMGCTIGQAISGASTLAMGSFVTFGSIVLGCAFTMKYQYYKMLYEDASIVDLTLTALAEVHLLPNGMRRLEAL